MESTSSDHRGCGGVDLISHLGDDVLVHVLGYLPTTADVACACLVSRLWRRLWPRVSSLLLASFEKNQERADRFVAFVNHVLAARAAHPDTARVEQIVISLFL
ncbi:hypothetical protein E2562_016578 [Oryza meyeriana var. granulata]|uniref:F-box domain-containing protein n=1 Tax=Oryza meyeriana var. granulata TaxID=110450 RepID=A0A6G1C5W2_9ORYZ|nr:hypothetical protein E2562_016578 [Oryza meyeriana var. granulata]